MILDNQMTDRQRQVYEIIVRSFVNGEPTSFRELMEATGITSPNGIKCHVDALIRKGYIVNHGTARGLRPVDSPIDRLYEEAAKACRLLLKHGEKPDALLNALKPFHKGEPPHGKADQVRRRRGAGVGQR